jgi:hypothetical protein
LPYPQKVYRFLATVSVQTAASADFLVPPYAVFLSSAAPRQTT